MLASLMMAFAIGAALEEPKNVDQVADLGVAENRYGGFRGGHGGRGGYGGHGRRGRSVEEDQPIVEYVSDDLELAENRYGYGGYGGGRRGYGGHRGGYGGYRGGWGRRRRSIEDGPFNGDGFY